jgi:hypothetical protein
MVGYGSEADLRATHRERREDVHDQRRLVGCHLTFLTASAETPLAMSSLP